MDRRNEDRKNAAYRTGLLASVVVNTSLAAPKEPRKPADFFPELGGGRVRSPRVNKRAVANGLKAALKAMAMAKRK